MDTGAGEDERELPGLSANVIGSSGGEGVPGGLGLLGGGVGGRLGGGVSGPGGGRAGRGLLRPVATGR